MRARTPGSRKSSRSESCGRTARRARVTQLRVASPSRAACGSALTLRDDGRGREDSLRFGLSPAAVCRAAHRTHLSGVASFFVPGLLTGGHSTQLATSPGSTHELLLAPRELSGRMTAPEVELRLWSGVRLLPARCILGESSIEYRAQAQVVGSRIRTRPPVGDAVVLAGDDRGRSPRHHAILLAATGLRVGRAISSRSRRRMRPSLRGAVARFAVGSAITSYCRNSLRPPGTRERTSWSTSP